MKASTLVFTFLLYCPLFAQDGPNRTRPNVILIMADDMGYEALSSNGSESCKSPNLDKLAAEGCALPTASPTRSAPPHAPRS